MFNFLLEEFDIMLYDHLFMFNDDAYPAGHNNDREGRRD